MCYWLLLLMLLLCCFVIVVVAVVVLLLLIVLGLVLVVYVLPYAVYPTLTRAAATAAASFAGIGDGEASSRFLI